MSKGRDNAKRWGVALCSVVVVAVLTTGASAGPAADRGRPLTTITIGVLPLDATSQALVARHRGYFRRQGLDAKITFLADPSQITASILSGSTQFSAISMGALAVLKSRGAPLRMVASAALYRRNEATTVLVAGKGQRIRGARDLVGKTVAVDAPNTIAHVAALRWLKRNGVSPEAVDFRPTPFAEILSPLARGTVHAAVLPEPYVTLALAQRATRVAKVFDAVCPKACLYTGWIARRDVDPGVVARFRNAIQLAAVWANNEKNHPASARILRRYVPLSPAVMRKMTRVRFAERLVPRLAQPWIDAYAELKLIPSSFAAIEFVK